MHHTCCNMSRTHKYVKVKSWKDDPHPREKKRYNRHDKHLQNLDVTRIKIRIHV